MSWCVRLKAGAASARVYAGSSVSVHSGTAAFDDHASGSRRRVTVATAGWMP
jgi:hypothetical protein